MKLQLFFSKKLKGQTLVELIMVIGIAAIVLPALLTGLFASRNGKPQQAQRMQAITVLKETETAVRNVRNTNWASLGTNGTFHTEIVGSQWTLVANPSTNSNGIKQEVVINDVMRDQTGAIATAGGTLDPSTKKVDIIISWIQPYVSSINSTMYMTRTENETYIQTTQTDFNAGSKTDTTVVSTGGSATDGQIELDTSGGGSGVGGGGNTGDWCAPNLSITALDLPKSGVANALSAIEGRVFAGTGDNSSGVSFANVAITNTDPPNSSIAGTFNGYKTNDVFGEASYGYLATDDNAEEVAIVNLTASPYSKVGYFNAPGNGDGNSVFVSGNIGYMISGNKLYTFDLSGKTGSRPQLGSLTLDGIGNNIYVRGSYVYVAIGSTSNQLEIVQVADNGATLTKAGSLSVTGQAAKDVYVDFSGDRAYVATAVSATQRELFVVNTSNKSNPVLVSSYDTNGMNPKGITAISEHNRAIIIGTGGEEYQVIDISDESAPAKCGGLQINTGVNGVSSVFESDGDAYSYIITGDASAELKIIEGGAGGFVETNWCTPQEAVVDTLTLPREGNVLSAKLGEAFVGTGDGTSGESFVDIGVTTPPPPTNPNSSIISTFSDSSRTNGVYSDGNYAYLAVNGSTSQVLILNIATSPFTKIGSINLPSGTNANGVFIADNIAYVTSGNKLYTFDVTNKSGVHDTVLSQIDMYAEEGVTPTAKQVTVVNGKAFVGASNTRYGLQVFTTGGGSALRLVGVSDLPWEQQAQGLSVNTTGTRGYVAFNNGTGSVQRGYFAVDTSEADAPVWWPLPNFYPILATYSSGSTDPTGITLAAGSSNRVMLTGSGGSSQYQVIDVSVEADPLMCGGLAVAQGVKGVASILDSYDRGYAYIITGESTNQFKIIQGGSGGGNYTENGTFESSIFDSGSNSAFNRILANVNKPSQTTIRLQVASAPQISGSCVGANYSYVGPDGSTTSFFTPSSNSISAPIPFGNYSPDYENPARCFRYKAWFSTWSTDQTPMLNDVTVNYSP